MDQFEADIRKGAGQELESKFLAVHSSSALVVNTFAPFKDRMQDFELLGLRSPAQMRFEEQLRIFPNRGPANIDVWLDFGEAAIAVESKLLEYLTPKPPDFAAAYDRLEPPFSEPSWWAVYREARARKRQHLDVAQLVKHYFGLRRLQQSGQPDKRLTLLYLFWEPVNWTELTECRQHRAEIEALAGQVAGALIAFRWMTYPTCGRNGRRARTWRRTWRI
jgi:hypothetical protein